MGITVKRTGPPVKFDAEKAAKVISAFVPGAILRRTAQGLDMNGDPFAPYRPAYREALASMGEDQRVDLRLTGGLMGSIRAKATVTATEIKIEIAPNTGTSPRVTPSDGRAKRTGEQGPPHNVLGYWIHHGTPHMRARPFMGLSPAQADELNRLLAKSKLWG